MPRIANATTETDEHEEIEVTPEMIEAGIAAWLSFNPKFEAEDSGVARIYAAMARARRKKDESGATTSTHLSDH